MFGLCTESDKLALIKVRQVCCKYRDPTLCVVASKHQEFDKVIFILDKSKFVRTITSTVDLRCVFHIKSFPTFIRLKRVKHQESFTVVWWFLPLRSHSTETIYKSLCWNFNLNSISVVIWQATWEFIPLVGQYIEHLTLMYIDSIVITTCDINHVPYITDTETCSVVIFHLAVLNQAPVCHVYLQTGLH